MPPRRRPRTPAARARQAAQRRTARALRAGTYQPGPQATAYRRAAARLSGRTLPGRMGEAGWRSAEHFTLGGAFRHAARLPEQQVAYIAARGRSSGASLSAGRLEWQALHPAAEPDWFTGDHLDRMRVRQAELFSQTPRRYAVVWRPA